MIAPGQRDLRRRLRRATYLIPVIVALGFAACTSTVTVTQAPGGGPSRFQMGFDPRLLVQQINATPGGPRCPGNPPPMSSHTGTGIAGPWSMAEWMTTCEDPGDGTALRQAWSTQITDQLQRAGVSLGSVVSGDGITDEWQYAEGQRRGSVDLNVLPAPDGKYWVQIRIVEPQ
jgi:hypothetical protein